MTKILKQLQIIATMLKGGPGSGNFGHGGIPGQVGGSSSGGGGKMETPKQLTSRIRDAAPKSISDDDIKSYVEGLDGEDVSMLSTKEIIADLKGEYHSQDEEYTRQTNEEFSRRGKK